MSTPTVEETRLQEYIRAGRHKARTDLHWLCHNILGMKKIASHVHGPIIEFLQGFEDVQGEDRWDSAKRAFVYTPRASDPVDAIPDERLRRRLILAPRGWYKTSLNIIAHTIQWILNFPDVTILIMHASQETAEQMLALIKYHFQHNETMRYFFPEFCAKRGAKEFGTQTAFNCPTRRNWSTSSTVSVAGVESVRTGMHYHVMKFTDIVDPKNSATKDQCEKIVYAYGMARNLLIGPAYWMDVEGTRYNFSDLYGRIVDEWESVEKELKLAAVEGRAPRKKHLFSCFTMGCFKKDVTGVKDREEFTPDELNLPYLIDPETGHEISRFPEEFPWEALNDLRNDPVTGEQLFASQQLNNPVETDNVIFSLRDIKWKTPEEIAHVNIQYFITIVDTAETASKRSDFTAITTLGVDRMNRRYVVDIRHGKFLPDRIVDLIFEVQQKWRPVKIKVEETGFVRGLRTSIERRRQMTGVSPNFEWITRDTQIAKTERITMTLQPWFRNGLIFFSTALDEHVKEQIKHELTRFPKYQHDDILDTLADAFQNEFVFGPVKEDPSIAASLEHARRTMFTRLADYNRIFHPELLTGASDPWSGLGS
jgi:predicted phage terminase large subunit-like protein